MADQGSQRIPSVSQLRTGDELSRWFRELQQAREPLEREWKMNLAFYRGNQYVFYNRELSQVMSYPVEDGDKPRYRVRLVSNQIAPSAQSLLAKLTKTKPTIYAAPGSGSDRDLKAAQMADSLLEHWWHDLSMNALLQEALLWTIITGQGWWKISWDPHAGKPQRFMLAPDGQPILDEQLKDMFRAQLEQMGMSPQEQPVFMGDVKVDVLSPFDVYIDPTVTNWVDAKYAVCVHHMSPDEVLTRYGVEVQPDSSPVTADSFIPLIGRARGKDQRKTVKKVYVGYFLPSAALPGGRYVVWVDGASDDQRQILADSEWPYPFSELPLIKFPSLFPDPDSVYDDCPTTHARPIQKEINKTVSQIVEMKNLTVRPRVWAPAGSLRIRYTTEAGQVIEYKPIGGMRPETEQPGAIPPYVFNALADMGARLKDIYALSEVTEGGVPPNVEAGIAIDLLQEMATDRLAPPIMLIEQALARGGQQLLALAQQNYIEPRLLKIRGSGGSTQVRRFTQADISGGITIHADVGSGLPRTRAGRQARVMHMMELGIIQPQNAWKYLDVADLRGLSAQFQADEDQAHREIDKIVRGELLNPEAVQAAAAAIRQGINPETGEPLQSADEARMLIQKAGLMPGPADNHPIHAQVFQQWITSVEFENLPPHIRMNAIMHYELTQQAMASLPQPEPQAPRISMQIHGTAGPTVAAEMLRAAGVDATPQDFLEPPLETMVVDSIDKPDTDAAANDPLTPEEVRLYELSLKLEEVREKRAKADLAQKKASQSDFRPQQRAA